MTKRQERTSLNVSVEIRDMLVELLYELQAAKKRQCTQDDVIRFLVEFYLERA
ncbi:MAG: hypothetical protein WAN56_06695 [Halobacteriota archaeon]